MAVNRVVVIGEKEFFISRVLGNKIRETGVECRFSCWTVNEISQNLENFLKGIQKTELLEKLQEFFILHQ